MIPFDDAIARREGWSRAGDGQRGSGHRVPYEELPAEAVPVYGERIVEAVPIGADTGSILWPLLRRALAEHAGAEHRMVTETVRDAVGFIDRHLAGTNDIIDAREAMGRANVVRNRLCELVDNQEHPARTAVIMAADVLHALWRTDQTKRDNIAMRTIMLAATTKDDAVVLARKMASMLADLEVPRLSVQHRLQHRDRLNHSEAADGVGFETLASPMAVPGSAD